MAHSLLLLKGSELIDITPLVGTIGRRSNRDELGEEITFDIAISESRLFPDNPCDVGDMVIFSNSDGEITRAIIVDENRNGRDPIGYTAFDFAFYLNKSNAIYQFKKMQADKCIRKIAQDFGVTIGNITSIPVLIDKIFNDVVVSEIIKEIIEIAEQKLGIKYLMEMRQGKLYIEQQKDLVIQSTFKLAENLAEHDAMDTISNPTRTRSIQDMVNSIQIVGNDDKLIYSQSDDAMVDRYGKLQKVIQLDKKEKRSAKEIAENELKELSKVTEESSVELIGDDRVRAGRILEVNEPITGMQGKYIIHDVSHTISGGIHKMTLGLEGM